MAGHQQARRLLAIGQARTDQAVGAGQRQAFVGQVATQRTALVVGEQLAAGNGVAMADQAHWLAVEVTQGGQFQHPPALADPQVGGLGGAGRRWRASSSRASTRWPWAESDSV